MKNRIQGITRRVKPHNEIRYLRVNNEEAIVIPTITKRERQILNAIRKILIAFKFENIDLTNRKKYIKNVNVSQEKYNKMKANNKFEEYKNEKQTI